MVGIFVGESKLLRGLHAGSAAEVEPVLFVEVFRDESALGADELLEHVEEVHVELLVLGRLALRLERRLDEGEGGVQRYLVSAAQSWSVKSTPFSRLLRQVHALIGGHQIDD